MLCQCVVGDQFTTAKFFLRSCGAPDSRTRRLAGAACAPRTRARAFRCLRLTSRHEHTQQRGGQPAVRLLAGDSRGRQRRAAGIRSVLYSLGCNAGAYLAAVPGLPRAFR